MSETDPYVWPDSGVLRNRLDLRTQGELSLAEYEYTLQRRLEIEQHPIQGDFNLDHLCAIHRYLFQDIFDWAGKPRTVDITKETSVFLPAARIHVGAEFTFRDLHSGRLLTEPSVSDDIFIDEITDALDRINFLHPFREGNGRAQRAFLDQVASMSGRHLTWRNVTDEENRLAAIASVTEGRTRPLREMMEKVARPPAKGRAGFDIDAYRVPPSDTSIAGDAAVRCRRCGRPLHSDESIARGFDPDCWEKRHN